MEPVNEAEQEIFSEEETQPSTTAPAETELLR